MRYMFLTMLAAASPASADTLPLARGSYVERGGDCAAAARSGSRDFNGQGIGSAGTSQCTGRVLAQIRRRYTVRQTCLRDQGARGGARRGAENVKVRVDSRTSFTDLRSGTHYRLCPVARG